MKYIVRADRTTTYQVEADDREHAIDEMIEGSGTELNQETRLLTAVALCPECGDELTDRTTRTVGGEQDAFEEPSYCDRCGREVEFMASGETQEKL